MGRFAGATFRALSGSTPLHEQEHFQQLAKGNMNGTVRLRMQDTWCDGTGMVN